METTSVSREESAWERVVVLHHAVESRLAAALQERSGLSLSEYRALAHLARAANGELRMQELADAVNLDQSSISRLVARLERAGSVRRVLCPSDRRGIYTVITPEGRARAETAQSIYRSTLSAALDEAARAQEYLAIVQAFRG